MPSTPSMHSAPSMDSAPTLLLDENLSWRVANALVELGYSVVTTQALGLNGQADDAVFQHARDQHYIIVTRDRDFLTRYPPPHSGILVLRCSERANNTAILQCLVAALPALLRQDLTDTVRTIAC